MFDMSDAKELLINNFTLAHEEHMNYVAVLIEMDGFEKPEIIINERENFDSKLEYYLKTYDDDLNHKFAKGIRIIGYTRGKDFDDIQYNLSREIII